MGTFRRVSGIDPLDYLGPTSAVDLDLFRGIRSNPREGRKGLATKTITGEVSASNSEQHGTVTC